MLISCLMRLNSARLLGDTSLGKAGDDFLAYSVQPGDRLWNLVSVVYGTHDPQFIQLGVQRTAELNELGSPDSLKPGQLLIFSTAQAFDYSIKSMMRESRSHWEQLSLIVGHIPLLNQLCY